MSAVLAAEAVTKLVTPHIDWAALAPLLILLGGALLLLVVAAMAPAKSRIGWHAISAIVVASAAIASVFPLWHKVQGHKGPFSTAGGAVAIDGFSLFVTVILCASVILASLLLDGYLRRENLQGSEGYVLLLLSAAGGVVMASANDLIVMFLGLEILSIAVYVLAGLHRRRSRSGEAAMKYFVLGAFSSAFFLYGIALVYGATGSTSLPKINAFLAQNALTSNALLLTGFALLLVGFGFKVAAVPFHSWSPDVYQGSPSPVVAYMASGVKVAAFAGLLRVFTLTFATYREDWKPLIYGLAVVTLLVGAALAIVQTDVKRMMAYSSISHAGWMLVGVQSASARGTSAVLFYLATYTVLVGGSFGIITVLGRRGDGHHALSDYKGLARREPMLALTFAIFLLAQAGTPLTTGFVAKFYVITAAVDAGYWHLAVIAMLSAVIAAFLYLRIVVTMYTDDDTEVAADRPRLRVPMATGLAIVLAFAITVGVGILPDPLTHFAKHAVPALIQPKP